MSQYVLFAGLHYYPSGGWQDFKGDYASLIEAIRAVACISCDWWHIVDLASGEIAESGARP